METNQYRLEFAAYSSKLQIAHYKYRAGLEAELHIAPIYDRYRDLFTREAIDSLQQSLLNVSDDFETEKAGLRALLGEASIGYLDAQAIEFTDECARRDAAAKVSWDGESLRAFSVPKRLANEGSSERRRELYNRWTDAVSECNELRATRLESQHESAHALGFESYRKLYTDFLGTDYERLANKADGFLRRTEVSYKRSLADLANRELPDVAIRDLKHADHFFLQRATSLDRYFPASELMSTYVKAMKGLGIRTEQQTNIHIDDESRPSKHPRASCLRVNPPDDVRLLVAPIGGATDYLTLFHEAGHAQHFGWTSSGLMKSHPEFIYSPDYATTEGYAFLFNHLFHDARWLKEYRPGLSAEQARRIVSDLSVLTMQTIRRFCAKLRHDIELHDSSDLRSENLSANYAILQTEATGFERGRALYLSDVDDGFYSAAYLRAWAFEAGLREYLRTKYGYRWWVSHKAGDELIDLWSTSSRYSVEELARLLGFGDLDFDLLADTWIASMSEE